MELMIERAVIKTTEEGFLSDLGDWSEKVAIEIARQNNIEMTSLHWDIVYFIRDYYQDFKHLPNTRVFTKALKKKLGEEIGNSRYLHNLFPQGPLKYACKIAGLPKPPTCL